MTYKPGMEPERYEFDAPLPYRFSFARRGFFKTVGAGIVVLGLLDKVVGQESGRRGGGRGGVGMGLLRLPPFGLGLESRKPVDSWAWRELRKEGH